MGIQGLLPQLKSIMAPIGLEELRGQTVAVDTYSWLHKGALSCGDRLCKGIPTSRHIEYCMHRVNMLRHYAVKPILIFDGGLLPIKSDQETKRARSRKENLERAREHEAAGNSRAAFKCYQKAVDITPRIASELIQVLKKEKVDYIVAPYEADAQMTFLSVNKLVDAVITEDSDLIPFGCSRIIFKMDKFGHGVEFHITRLEINRELDFNGFTRQMLLEMCILSGCDYLPSLPGMGVKRAHALIQKLKSHEKIIKHLRYSAVSVSPQYEENFKKAIRAFKFQRVYDPATENIAHLSSVPHDLSEDLDFLGPWLPQNVAKGIALGNIDPLTKEPFEPEPECSAPAVDKVYPTRESIVPSNGRKRLDLPVQKNILTNYFCLASLEAKRKFRAPKITPKQQILNESSLPSPQTEYFGAPDSIEDTSLPTNHIQVSQCSSELLASEPTQDDPVSAASQCSSEHFSCEFPRDDSANISPQCSSLDGGSYPPSEDTGIQERKVEADYCTGSTIPTGSCSVGKLPGISEPSLLPHNREPYIPVQHYTESNVASTDKDITVRNSYFKTVNKGAHTNQEDKLDDKEDSETGNHTLSGDQLWNSGMLKRRKLSGLQSFEDEMLQPISSDESPPVVDEGCGTDRLDDTNIKTEGRFGCNVSHVNRYSGIAEKSMDKFAALISSFRYPGSRASGLRAPLKDVKNTLSVSSVLRPPERSKFRCSAKKTDLGPHSKSRHTSDDKKNAGGPPDISTFAYRPVNFFPSDQGKITTTDDVDGLPDLGTFAYTPMASTVCRPDRSKFTGTTMRIVDSPPDLSTFAYNPTRTVVRRAEGSRFAGTTLKAAGGTSRNQFK
ncbi:exonuclease 1-like isoform X2 [Phragmites australis]|uniref:exonuclease 1-like isoform X2 n=1 Tax=Phragmites australis TaxID=29695 RepID=UPI002D7938F8|nr:exonuclease 1-like isoform X2 [Phragmites australis]